MSRLPVERVEAMCADAQLLIDIDVERVRRAIRRWAPRPCPKEFR